MRLFIALILGFVGCSGFEPEFSTRCFYEHGSAGGASSRYCHEFWRCESHETFARHVEPTADGLAYDAEIACRADADRGGFACECLHDDTVLFVTRHESACEPFVASGLSRPCLFPEESASYDAAP